MNWQGSPELRVLLGRARKRLQSNGISVTGTILVHAAPEHPRLWELYCAITGSTRVTSATTTMHFPLEAVDRWLRSPLNSGQDLLAVLTAEAPLTNRAAERAGKSAAADAARAEITHLLGARFPAAQDRLRAATTPDLISGAATSAARVLDRLPGNGIAITRLAADATGATKALASGGVRRLALAALAAELQVPAPDSASGRRALWEQFGVVTDAVSSTVLLLGLRVAGTSVLAQYLDACANAGEPAAITLSQLIRWPVICTAPEVFVCENPAVVTSAMRSGVTQPLVCTQGQRSLAAATLLSACTGTIHWRGDFDWSGLRATARAMTEFGARPWRMDHETYRCGLARGESEAFKARDSPCASPWDPPLATAMRTAGRAVMEERLIDVLLGDLR